MRAAKKRYHLGGQVSWGDANRLLGLPANSQLSWEEFLGLSNKHTSSIKQKIFNVKENKNGQKSRKQETL